MKATLNQLVLHMRKGVGVVGEEYVLVFPAEVSGLLPIDLLALVSISSHYIFATLASLEVAMVCSGDRHSHFDSRVLLALYVLTSLSQLDRKLRLQIPAK